MRFFNTTKYRTSIVVVLLMFLQVLMPVVGEGVLAYGLNKSSDNFNVEIVEGDAIIDWEFTIDPEDDTRTYTQQFDFTVDKEGSGDLVDEESQKVIGDYTITKDGFLDVNIDKNLFETSNDGVELDKGTGIDKADPEGEITEAEDEEGDKSEDGKDFEEENKDPDEDNESEGEDLELGEGEDQSQEGEDETLDSEEEDEEEDKEEVESDGDESEADEGTDPEDGQEPETEEDGTDDPENPDETETTETQSMSLLSAVFDGEDIGEATGPRTFKGTIVVEEVREKPKEGIVSKLTGMFGFGLSSIGKDLGNIFTFVSMTKDGNVINENDPVDVTDGTTITLDYIWDTIGLTVEPGDWSETEIPDAFKLDTDFTGIDIITDGVNVGKYSIIDNKLKFVFGDGITEAGEIQNGELGFGMNFNKEKFNKDITQEVTFKGKLDKKFNVVANHTGTITGISKSGVATTDGNSVTKDAKEITWTVDIMNPGDTEMTNASLTDTLPGGLTLDTTSIVITDLTVGLDGTVYDSETSSKSASSFPIAFDKINKYKGYRVKYKTIIDNYALKEFTNYAKLSYDGNSDGLPAFATVNEIERSNPIEKTGKKSGEHKIDWQIDINKAGGKVGKAMVDDDLPPELILDSNSIKVYKLTRSGGSWIETLDSSKNFTSFPINLGKLELTDAYRIKYITDIDYSEVNSGEYQKENNFENSASLKDGSDEMGTDEANVKITRSDLLKKTGGANVNYTDKKLNWTVTVNQAKHPITNAVLTDQLPAGLKISAADIEIKRIGAGGETDSTNHTVTLDPTDGDGSTATNITINFDGTIKGTYEIKYSTTITDFTKNSFENTASFTGTGIGEGVTVDPVTVKVPNNSYTKKKGSIDHAEKTMSWTIEANPTREAIKTLRITDTFPNKGLILLNDTKNPFIVKVGSKTLLKDTDYTLEVNGVGYQEGFIVKFNETEDSLPINDKLTITYDTSYDTELYSQIIKNTGDGTYKNNATFVGTTINGHDISSYDDDSQTLVEASWNTGKKLGKLKSVNSNGDLEDGWISGNTRKIQWEVYINYQKHNIGSNIKVSDTLAYDGKVDMDSIEVREYDVRSNGDTDITGNPIGKAGNYSVTSVDNDKGFELTFTDNVTKRYAVVFTTSVPDISTETYSNTAYVKGTSFTEATYTTSVGFTPYNKIVSKETIGVDGTKVYTDDEVKWKVRINDALSKVTENVTVVDKISAGLIFNKDSVEVYKLGKTDRVLVSESEYTVTFENDETELKLVFNDSIDSTYEIEYSTIVTATTGNISNSVEYSGGNLTTKSVPEIKYSAEQFSYVGGDPAKGAIKITKKDGDKLLAGAEFEVWYLLNGEDRQFTDKDKPEFVTDSNGELIIQNLPLRREYTIKEVKAPKGYIKKDNPVATIKVDNNAKEDKTGAYLLTVENEKIKGNIEFTKVNESDEPLEGVEFTLYDKDNNETKVTSGSDGKVSFTDVEYGDYTIQETSTLEGYILYSETLNASIGNDDNGKTVKPTKGAETIESLTNIIKKGNLEIKKTDGEGTALPGAKFKLYKQDSEGNLGDVVKVSGVDLVATSDAYGIVSFTNIPYGDYIIKEFSAPDSYAPSTEEIKLSIVIDGATVKPTKGDLGSDSNPVVNTKVIGDIEVKKLDEDGETGLEGAVFVLEQGVKEKYSGTTDENGSYVFKDVKYGTYTLKEKTAPEGYNLTNQTEEVVIKEQDQKLIIKKFINTKIRGDIKLKKVGEDGEGLENAIFSIYKSTDIEFENPIAIATSNADGEATFTGIAHGEYKIKETTAPTGYNLSDTVLDAKITTQDELIDLTNDPVPNTKIRGNIEILKRNRNTHSPLTNATIAVYRKYDELLMEAKTTGADGKVVFEDLEYGEYYYKETKAPAGYILDNTKYDFSIVDNSVTLGRNLDNRRRPYYPPVDPPVEDPTEPTDPKDPPVIDPTDPEDPPVIDPTDPTDPEDPVVEDPTEPSEPSRPSRPSKPDPVEPTQPKDPKDPPVVDPIAPVNPEQPQPPLVDPVTPTQPVIPEVPTVPTVQPFKPFDSVTIEKNKDGDPVITNKDITTPIKLVEVPKDGKTPGKVEFDPKTGKITVKDMKPGEKVELAITTTVDDKEIVTGKITVTVNEDGEPEVYDELIDPYGTIRDSKTGEIIGGVKVELYYSDTPRNRAKGIVPGTIVDLPEIDGFLPNNNKNPQVSVYDLVWSDEAGDHGNYAWLVFPESDYYIKATKEGYETYTSDTISVEWDIVKHDLYLEAKQATLPKTGDTSNVGIYMAGLFFIALGVFTRKKGFFLD